MRPKAYEPLRNESDDSLPVYEVAASRTVLDEARFWRRSFSFLAICILLSLTLNVALFWQAGFRFSAESSGYKSRFAELAPETLALPIHAFEEYVNEENLTQTTANWEIMNGDTGVVALPDSFAKEKGIPLGLRWPWDETRGVYLLQAYHNLHCLRTVYRSIMDYHYKRPQRVALVHILHCLDELRQDTICNADDTPRFATTNPPSTGQGQVRHCRDWDALEKWAVDNTACFKHVDGKRGPIIQRFKTCPHGEKPWLLSGLE